MSFSASSVTLSHPSIDTKEYMVAIAQSGKRSMKELAREFGYSERYFRRMVIEYDNNKENKRG